MFGTITMLHTVGHSKWDQHTKCTPPLKFAFCVLISLGMTPVSQHTCCVFIYSAFPRQSNVVFNTIICWALKCLCVLLYLCWVIHPYSLRSSLRSSTLTVCMVRRYQRPRSINSSPLQKQWYVCGMWCGSGINVRLEVHTCFTSVCFLLLPTCMG